MKRTILGAAILAILVALVPVALTAVSQARINGVVTDQSGAPVEGAAVTVTYQFTPAAGQEPAHHFSIDIPTEWREVAVPFEFLDIPLP